MVSFPCQWPGEGLKGGGPWPGPSPRPGACQLAISTKVEFNKGPGCSHGWARRGPSQRCIRRARRPRADSALFQCQCHWQLI